MSASWLRNTVFVLTPYALGGGTDFAKNGGTDPDYAPKKDRADIGPPTGEEIYLAEL